MEKSKITTIDIEPTWEELCNAAQSGALQPKELMKACVIADIVRQAQKRGDKSVTFIFNDGGSILVQTTNEPATVTA